MKKMIAVLALGLSCQPAWALTPVEKLKQVQASKASQASAVESGRRLAAFCFNCHGEDGNSKQPDVPNLAGQNAAYLLEQIRKFSTGERRNEFMQGLIKALPDDDRVNVAIFFAVQTLKPSSAKAGASEAPGKEIYGKVCTPCHGPAGHGSETIPHLAGQQREYLVKSLLRYRANTGERRDKGMSEVAAKLGEADIRHVAAYLSAMN